VAFQDPHRDRSRKEILGALGLISQMGLTMAISMGISIFLGKWLDEKLGTSPWFLLLFCLVGIYAALRNMYTLTKKYWKK